MSEATDAAKKAARSRRPGEAKPRMSLILDRTRAEPDAAQTAFSKAGHVYAVLRRQILDGVYQPGEWLRLSHIAKGLNLSEMPVREALRLLEKDGLVTIHLHRGAQVAPLSFERALEITEARMILECSAALSALPFHSRHSLSSALAILTQMGASTENLVEFAIKNREFAGAIYATCPNSFLAQHIQHLWDQVWQYSSTAVFEVMRHRVQDTLAENHDICAGIEKADGEKVREAYDRRLQRSLEAWRTAIEHSHRLAATKRE